MRARRRAVQQFKSAAHFSAGNVVRAYRRAGRDEDRSGPRSATTCQDWHLRRPGELAWRLPSRGTLNPSMSGGRLAASSHPCSTAGPGRSSQRNQGASAAFPRAVDVVYSAGRASPGVLAPVSTPAGREHVGEIADKSWEPPPDASRADSPIFISRGSFDRWRGREWCQEILRFAMRRAGKGSYLILPVALFAFGKNRA